MRTVTFSFVFALLLASAVHAADIGIVPTKLIVVDKLDVASSAKLIFVSKDTAAGITKGSGTDVSQISAQFHVVYGNGLAVGKFMLPAGASNGTDGWLVNGDTVAKYVNKTAPNGITQAKVAVIKPGTLLKLVGKGLGDVPLEVLSAGHPGPDRVQTAYCVTNGAEENCHCSDFTGCAYKLVAGGTAAKLVCKTGTGEAACSAAPRTTSGCFVDTGLTIVDTCTNLEWEKKETTLGSGADGGNLHDVDNGYSWAGRCTIDENVRCQPNAAAAATCAQTGGSTGCVECGAGEGSCNINYGSIYASTTIWDWLNQVNAAGFAGHSDWRLPTSAGTPESPTGEPAEMESLIDLAAGRCGGGGGLCIDPIFRPVTQGQWTSSVSLGGSWYVNFGNGTEMGPTGAQLVGMESGIAVRAVRGGTPP